MTSTHHGTKIYTPTSDFFSNVRTKLDVIMKASLKSSYFIVFQDVAILIKALCIFAAQVKTKLYDNFFNCDEATFINRNCFWKVLIPSGDRSFIEERIFTIQLSSQYSYSFL